ncbi:MAG TPA: hypothetical protein VIT22_08600 [Pseudoxanthomonas sp.]
MRYDELTREGRTQHANIRGRENMRLKRICSIAPLFLGGLTACVVHQEDSLPRAHGQAPQLSAPSVVKPVVPCPSQDFEEFLKAFSNRRDLQETFVTIPWERKEPYRWVYEYVEAGDPHYPKWTVDRTNQRIFDPGYRYDEIRGRYVGDVKGLAEGKIWSPELANNDPMSGRYRAFDDLPDFNIKKVSEAKYEVKFSYRRESLHWRSDTYVKTQNCWYFTQEWYLGEEDLLNCKWPDGCRAAQRKLIRD